MLCIGTENSVSNKRVQQLYSQDQSQEVIDQAERQASSVRRTLENIQRVDEAGLSRNSPKYPRTPRATERHKYARDNTRVTYGESHEWITQPVQEIVPDTKRNQLLEADTALVYPIGDHDYHYPIMHKVCSTLEKSQEDNPDDSVVMQTRLNISPPEEYSGSSDLKVYKMFIAGILWWLRLHGLLGVKYIKTQVQFLGTWLKGNTSEWFTRNIECPDRPIRDWSLESVIEGLQKQFLNFLTHRQVSNKFDMIEQGQKTVQELIQELTKYAAQIVQYPGDYSFRRRLIAALRPYLQKEVLHRGITAEFSSMQDILEKGKDIEDSLWYDIGSQMSIEAMHNSSYTNQSVAKSSKQMIGVAPKGTTGQTMTNRQVTQPIWKMSSNTRKIPETTGKQPLKEGELELLRMWPKRTHATSVSKTE